MTNMGLLNHSSFEWYFEATKIVRCVYIEKLEINFTGILKGNIYKTSRCSFAVSNHS